MPVADAQTIQAEVKSIEAVTNFVTVIQLKPLTQPNYKAGQYLHIVLSEEDKRVFSIASCPDDEYIELHIGAGPEDSYPRGALDFLAANKVVTLEVGLGHAFFNDDQTQPIILMAGGTGFSYTRSIVRHINNHHADKKVIFYWGAKNESSLYANAEMAQLAANNNNIRYIPVVESPGPEWTGKTGFVHQAVMSDFDSLAPYDIYLAGPFKMAGIARDDFVKHGAHIDNLHADAFAFI